MIRNTGTPNEVHFYMYLYSFFSVKYKYKGFMESTLRLSKLKSGLFFKNIGTYWTSCNSSPTMTRTTQRLTELFLLLLQNQENARLSSSRQLDHKQWMEEEVRTVHVLFYCVCVLKEGMCIICTKSID